jgi:hypothetical protein
MLALWALALVAIGRILQVTAKRRLADAAALRERRAAYPKVHRYDTSGFVPRGPAHHAH